MSRIFLLRHAQSVANDKGFLAGRMDGVTLSKKGLKQREQLNQRLAGAKFDQVISSPIQRCLETIADFHSNPEIVEEFQEVHYGDWTGKKFTSLNRNRAWREIHSHPASVRFPSGETLPEVQTRALAGLDKHIAKKSKNEKSAYVMAMRSLKKLQELTLIRHTIDDKYVVMGDVL